MRLPKKERVHTAASVGRHMIEGVRYAFGFPPIRALLLLLALVSFATMPQAVLLPVFAADVLGGGPHTLGLLSAASGVGAFTGALYLASRSSVLGLGLAGFSRSESVWLSAALLVLTGCGMMVRMAAANTLIQTMVDEDKRGRVMSFFGMAFQGAVPFGSLLAGWLAGFVGVRAVAVPLHRQPPQAAVDQVRGDVLDGAAGTHGRPAPLVRREGTQECDEVEVHLGDRPSSGTG